MSDRVFISYARADEKFAMKLATDLETAGAAPWIDRREIEEGRRWDDEIDKALRKCSGLILVLSPASVESKTVLDEASLVLDDEKPVYPVVIRDCQVPFRFRRIQHLDFRGDYESALRRLRERLGLGGPVPEEMSPPPTRFPARRLSIGAVIGILLGLGLALRIEPENALPGSVYGLVSGTLSAHLAGGKRSGIVATILGALGGGALGYRFGGIDLVYLGAIGAVLGALVQWLYRRVARGPRLR